MDEKFLKVAVKPVAKVQVDILAAVKGVEKYALVGDLLNSAWQSAREAGLVTDAMLTPTSLPHTPRDDGSAEGSQPFTISRHRTRKALPGETVA